MGRKKQFNAAWFKHYSLSSNDTSIKILEGKLGKHVGYALYYKTMEFLSNEDYFQLELDEIRVAILCDYLGISEKELFEFIEIATSKSVNLLQFDNGILSSPSMVSEMESLLKKREYNRGGKISVAEKDITATDSKKYLQQKNGKLSNTTAKQTTDNAFPFNKNKNKNKSKTAHADSSFNGGRKEEERVAKNPSGRLKFMN